MDEIKQKILKIFIENIGTTSKLDNVADDADLKQYGLTSLNFVKLLFGLEDEFEIEIDDDEIDLDNFRTIKKITLFLKSKDV